MDKDRLINLLPEEYLPEPDFKAFPIFATALIILTVLLIWFQFGTDQRVVRRIKRATQNLSDSNQSHIIDADAFLRVQANARFIRSYMAVVPNIVLQAPDYWGIYNELEELLPEDTWIAGISFRSKPNQWPDLSVNYLSRGYSFRGPLATYDKLLGTPETPTRLKNLRMGGYRRTSIGGAPAATFQINMEVLMPQEVGLRSD